MSHESARKEKNGRRRNGDESIRRDRDILWKTFVLSSDHPWLNARHRQRAAEMPGFHLPTVAWHSGVAAMQNWGVREQAVISLRGSAWK
jgi:hypothetical protein